MRQIYLISTASACLTAGMFAWVTITAGFYWWVPLMWIPVVITWVAYFRRMRQYALERRDWAALLKYAEDAQWLEGSARWPRPWIHQDLDGPDMPFLDLQ